jgi:hypothetical protein
MLVVMDKAAHLIAVVAVVVQVQLEILVLLVV